MSYRELFRRIMHYEDFDRMPVVYWRGWPETMARWETEGLPKDADAHAYFNAEPLCEGVPVELGLFPLFEEIVLEETDEYRILRQNDGVICKTWKGRSSIPHFIDFLLKDPSGWPEYKKRLQPDAARLPKDLEAEAERLNRSDKPVAINCLSMIGTLRNWMGVENLAMATMMYPEFVAEYVDTVANLVCWAIEQVGGKIHIDTGWGWEDICFKTGPLIHPNTFESICVPGYRKIADTLRKYGCDLYIVDCDGMIDHLIPGWIEGGVNILFPIEIGTWKADPMTMRRKYGKQLRFFGGIDKLAIEKGHAAIDAEIELRKPLMAEGGFLPLPDHLITPDTPLEHMRYYHERIRELRF